MRIYTEEPHGHSRTFTLSCKFAYKSRGPNGQLFASGPHGVAGTPGFLAPPVHPPTYPPVSFRIHKSHTKTHARPAAALAAANTATGTTGGFPSAKSSRTFQLFSHRTHTHKYTAAFQRNYPQDQHDTHTSLRQVATTIVIIVCVCAHASQTVHIYMLWT